MDTATIVAIVSAVIACLALVWAVYTHLRTHRVSKLTYSISQLSDFDVPRSFLADIPKAPIAITITSRGSKKTEDIRLNLRARSPIDDVELSVSDADMNVDGDSLWMHAESLNPTQQIKFFLKCAGEASVDQLDEFELTHSEGQAVNESGTTAIRFSFLGLVIDYDLRSLATELVRIGPFHLK